ncbi:hypothetical protein ACTQ6A_15895 [Lachnospiraceae bacterium LCP25S3_G4]
MELNNMILVTENWKGSETNFLLTIEDYKESVLSTLYASPSETVDAMIDLCESWKDAEHWAELYFTSNKSISARYCNGEEQLRKFLYGYFNDPDNNWEFDDKRCSASSLEILKGIGITTDGKGSGIQYTYEAVIKTFEQGEILHNFNGSDYRVLEKLSARNLMLMNERKGEFMVAIGVNFYVRHPKGDMPTTNNMVYGIEWNHGIYYSQTPSTIDFREIRDKYGEVKEVISLQDFRNELQDKFHFYRKIIDSPLLETAVKETAQNSIYEVFQTGREEVFQKNLNAGMYDRNFLGIPETSRDMAR